VQGWLIRIGIIAVIVVGGLVFRDRLSSNAGDLKVGDCFDDPQGVETVKDVQHHPCNESHTSEVVFIGTVPGDNATYPPKATFTSWAVTNCVPAFSAYTGIDIATQEVLDMTYFFPLEDGWKRGEHSVTCYIFRVDGKPVSSSFHKS
jgi:hypothetical protein